MAKGTKFKTALSERLKDPKFAASYIMAAIEENDSEFLAVAIGEVVKAQGTSRISKATCSLEQRHSRKNGPSF